jgi:hypothetical protein
MAAIAAPFIISAMKNRFDIGVAALFISLFSAKLGGVYMVLVVSAIFCGYLIIFDKYNGDRDSESRDRTLKNGENN